MNVYMDSMLSADDILEFGFDHVCVATGSYWRRDVVARAHLQPVPMDAAMPVLTPDDLMDGRMPPVSTGGRVLIYDDDHYYMGGILAEILVGKGFKVTLVTPSTMVSEWTVNTLEQGFIQKLIDMGVDLVLSHRVNQVMADSVEADAFILVRRRGLRQMRW